jgi:hypothetical protein
MSDVIGATIVLAFGALDAALCGHNVQQNRYALAGFQAFGAAFCLVIATALLVAS